MLHFFDTAILLYAISPRPEETVRRGRADALLDEDDGALSIQVPQEFYAGVAAYAGREPPA